MRHVSRVAGRVDGGGMEAPFRRGVHRESTHRAPRL